MAQLHLDFNHNFPQYTILPDTFGNYPVMTPQCVNRNNWVFNPFTSFLS